MVQVGEALAGDQPERTDVKRSTGTGHFRNWRKQVWSEQREALERSQGGLQDQKCRASRPRSEVH